VQQSPDGDDSRTSEGTDGPDLNGPRSAQVDDLPDKGWAWWEYLWPHARFCGDYRDVD
jgi:hypothetical protein